MNRSKAILGGLAAVAVGGFLVYSGVKEYRNSKRLVNEGKAVAANVTDKDMSTGRKGRRSYYLAVEFKTEAGQEVKERLRVASADYDAANIGGTVPVHYLAEDPSICQVGNKAQVKWTTFVMGAFLAVAGGFGVARQASKSEDSPAEQPAETADASSSDNSGDQEEAA